MIIMLSLFITAACACSETITLDSPQIIRVSKILNSGNTVCIKSSKHFYVILNKFQQCSVEAKYMSLTDSDHISNTVTFNWKNYTQPFVDFGVYSGSFEITATENGAAFQLHAIRQDSICTGKAYVSTRATSSIQFNSKWNGNNQLRQDQRLCIFTCPFGEFKHIKLLYSISPSSNYLEFVAGQSGIQLSGDNRTNLVNISDPAYLMWNSGASVNPSFFRVQYESDSNMIDQSNEVEGFYDLFNETLPEPLTRAQIIGISFGVVVGVVAITVIVLVYVIRKKRKMYDGKSTNSWSSSSIQRARISRGIAKNSAYPVLVDDPRDAEPIETVEIPDSSTYTEDDLTDVVVPMTPPAKTEDDMFVYVEVEIVNVPSAFRDL